MSILPLQPSNTTRQYAVAYLIIFFICISKSYWLFVFPYFILNCIVYGTKSNKQKIHGPNRNFWSFVAIASLEYISIWQSFHHTSYNYADYFIVSFLLYSHLTVLFNFLYSEPNLFAKFTFYPIFIGWIAELHYSASLFSLYIFPLYPILSCCVYYGVPNIKYSVIMLYVTVYCYVLHSLLLSFTPNDAKSWTYVKIDLENSSNNKQSKCAMQTQKLKFNQYYIGNNIEENDSKQVLRICQISDCHLDSLFTANELKRLCENIVLFEPDLVLLTGDFYYTKNTDIPKGLLTHALAPLMKISHKCYACLGNHDIKTKKRKDDIETCVVKELQRLNIKLLRNESVLHSEYIEVIGFDFIKQNKDNQRTIMMKNVLKESKLNLKSTASENKHLKIVLLHNPKDFDDFDGNENIVVFSGHCHGGHVGIYALGSKWLPWFCDFCLYAWLTGLKDYSIGVFSKGKNRMYIHRGNTFYSKELLRFGVPAEQQTCILINRTD